MRSPWTCLWIAAGALTLLAAPRIADACGNNTHAWISIDARARLPAGPVRELLDRPGMERYLRNGTMFPDGGYAIGDDYGEMAHWEPFQDLYLEWIRSHYSPPWSDEAAAHIAFLLGMTSHGLADQVYDSNFMRGSIPVDPGWHTCDDSLFCSFDTETDLMWARTHGTQPNPQRWIPEAVFPELYLSARHTISVADMVRGTDLVGSAIDLVATGANDESLQAQCETDYPFAYTHIDEPARGAPGDISRMVPAYWDVIWSRLHGGNWVNQPVIATIPKDGSYGHPRDHSDVASRIAVVFARGLEKGSLKASSFSLVDSQGKAHPFKIDLFYGQSSHVVNIDPEEDYAENETYTLSVAPGVLAIDGQTSAASFAFTFHTSPPPPEPSTRGKKGCASVPVGALALLGLASLRRRRRVDPS